VRRRPVTLGRHRPHDQVLRLEVHALDVFANVFGTDATMF
jgi:hypothetical protein